MQPVKIQINSLEALERLIGGDSELEIEIRNSVVQKFTTKHLKALANSMQVKVSENSIKKYIEEDFVDIIIDGWKRKPVLKEDYKYLIEKKVEEEVSDTIHSEVAKYNDTLKDMVVDAVNRKHLLIEQMINNRLNEEAINALVDARIIALSKRV